MRKIITLYALLVFFIVAFLNPILNYVFIGTRSLQSLLLIPYVLFSFILLSKYKEKYFVIAIFISYLFIIINLIYFQKRGDELLIFYSLAFFSNGIIGKKYISKYCTDLLLNILFFVITGAIIHSFGLAFGLWGNKKLVTDLLGERIGSSGDIIDIIPFTIPFLLFYVENRSQRILKIISYFAVFLGLLRLIATGTRGITFSVIISVIIYIYYFHFSIRKINLKKLSGTLFILCIILALSNTFIIKQVSYLSNQYIEYNLGRGNETGIIREIEAKNDFSTFLDNPLIGAGFIVASQKMSNQSESSAGHFFLTGMLARIGILGTMFFLLAYFLYFKMMYKEFKILRTTQYFFVSTLIIVITYFILGNPLYLSQVWFVLPIFWSIILNYSKNEKNTHSVL